MYWRNPMTHGADLAHGMARRGARLGAVTCLLAATLALGACGASAQSSASRSQQPAATSTSAGGMIPGGGMAVRPCPGAVSDATQVGAVALTLTPSASSGALHVGELAQVRLPASLHWTLASQPTSLASVATAGGQDTSLNVCYWTFRAQSAGSVTLRFSGVQPCDNPPSNTCSSATTEQDFTITVG
ncbi:MAG TPA: hypothetical protein VF812_05260 [Ktedonobacterales bacterium]